MHQRHAVVGEQISELGKELVVVVLADVFEHADRYDAIILAGLFTIIAELKAGSVGKACHGRPLFRHFVLFDAQGHAGNVGARCFGQIQAKPSPAGANVQYPEAGPVEKQLGRDMALFVLLCRFQAVIGVREIGAGILAVSVEEEVI